jgi:arylsulfatase
MVDAWWKEAEANGVLPLDDRGIELFGSGPPVGTPHARNEYIYLHPISHIPSDAAPPIGGRAWTLTCDVRVPLGGCEGVLYARGSHNVGHTFFLQGGHLQFDYNALGTHYRARAPVELSAGEHTLGARFERQERAGMLTLLVDGRDVGSVHIPRLIRMLGSTGLDIGCDRLSNVVDDSVGPVPVTGASARVTFRIEGRREQADITARERAESARD